MLTAKRAFWATTALTGALMIASAAAAQSSASQTVEEDTQVGEVVVTGARGPANIEGIVAEQAIRARSTITQELIATQPAGQTIFQTLNILPGLNFVNTDPYGASGGNVRLRGFDGNRISLTFDGIPLNDTGNYAIFTNQQLDPELITQSNVNTGTTDVDSPTASATGGTINYVTRRPGREFGGFAVGSVGEDSYGRIFGLVDSGEFGPWGTTAFAAASYQRYDKFRGPGELERQQYNARLYQDFGDGNFMSLAINYNENRNNQYRNVTLAQLAQFGDRFDNISTCVRDTPTAGVVDNENSGNANDNATPASCTNYFNLRINPSNTGNIRGQISYNLGAGFRITFDPSFQYVLANGGGTAVVGERDGRVIGRSGLVGFDLNGDGDTIDTNIRYYNPNNTNTRRYGFTSSLIYDLNDNNRFRVAFTTDYGRHRQTAEFGLIDAQGDPQDVFAGKDGRGDRVATADGSFLRGRDRFSIASLNQISAQYRGDFLDNRLRLDLGVRAPFFRRELNQYCFSQNASTNVLCTTQAPFATLANGNVTFAAGANATQYIAPYERNFEYDDVLPNVGASYRVADDHTVFVSYAEGFSAPRTDNLYTVARLANGSFANPGVEPETTQNIDIGYRYQTSDVIVALNYFHNDFQNRIVSSFDQEFGTFIDRNIGDVELQGFEAQVTVTPIEQLLLYGSVSYIDSTVKSNLVTGATTPLLTNVLPTAGRRLVETPEWQVAGRIEYEPIDGLTFGLQGKFVGERFSTDVNDQQVDQYVVSDADIRFELARFGFEGSWLQLNVTNLFDEEYLGNISSQTNALAIPGVTSFTSNPTYSIGAPRTIQLSLRAQF